MSALPITESEGPREITYSALSLFRNCRKAYQHRHINCLVPIQTDDNLRFGSLIHNCLEQWHGGMSLEAVMDDIDTACAKRNVDLDVKRVWHLARAIMRNYAARYPKEDWEVIALEKTFTGPIINPETGAPSRSYVLSGKVDGIVKREDGNYILEHKTASSIDGDYLDKLWTDFQITLYSRYIEQCLGIRIAGVIYNVLVKAKLQQGKGETEAEFEARRAELLAKSKTGKTTATRKMPEPDDAFQQRLLARYAEPGMLHREVLYLSRDQFGIVQSDLWELTQQFLDCKRRGVFYRNTGFCFNYHRPCAYYPLCRSNGSPNVIESFYEVRPPHEELRSEDPVDTEKEIF